MQDYDIVNKQWKVKLVEHPTHPFFVIDNYYNEEEEKAIWKELEFYNSIPREKIKRAETTIVAKDENGVAKSKAYRHYLSEIYTQESYLYSNIHRFMYKGRTKQLHNYINKCMPHGRSYITSNSDNTLISYYEENDHYKAHHDVSLWTVCTWFVKEPRLFDGGDFDFPESEYEVKLKHNRSVYFPSCYLHRVSPVKFHTKPKEIGYGRYTITHFYNAMPTNSNSNA